MATPNKEIEFIFDFASPNGYLALKVLPEIARSHGATIRLNPCLLGGIFKLTGNQAPMMAFGNIPNKMAYEGLELQRFVKKHGLTDYKFNPHFPVMTLLPMRGMIAAGRRGKEAPYVEAVLKAMWEDEKDASDPEVLKSVLDEAGLDGAAILEMTQDPEIKQALLKNTEDAARRGAFGIPTFFVGEEMFFGKDRLDQVEEALSA